MSNLVRIKLIENSSHKRQIKIVGSDGAALIVYLCWAPIW